MLHHDDHASGAVDEVHRPAHAVDHLAGDQPVGQVAAGVDLHRTQDGDVEVLAADHAEAHRRVEEAGAGQDRHRLLAGVDQVGVLLALVRVGPDAENAVLAVEGEVHTLRHEVRHQGRHADPEVDVLAVLEVDGHPGGELVAGERHQRFSSVLSVPAAAGAEPVGRGRVVRFSMFLPSGPTTTTRSTKIPGRCTSSGRMSPGSPSSSISAIVIRAAMPASGLKLRADSWNTRLPCRSPRAARTSPKSAVSAVSSTYCGPSNSRPSLAVLVAAPVPAAS